MKQKIVSARLLRYQKGMTLIEIMVVVAILGLVSTLITVAYLHHLEQVRIDATKVQLQNLAQALDIYKARNGTYPTTDEGLAMLQTKKAIKKVPLDAWGKNFDYTRNSSRSFTIKSYGPDGAEGGMDSDADIVFEQ